MFYAIFGLAVIVLMLVGFYRRKQADRTWIQEERYEDSGDWLDKRSGERSSYGRLDREREDERRKVFAQGQMQDLAAQIGRFLQLPPGTQTAYLREKTAYISMLAETLMQHKILPDVRNIEADPQPETTALKKHILQWIYDTYPVLLELPIEQIKDLDRRIEAVAADMIKNKS